MACVRKMTALGTDGLRIDLAKLHILPLETGLRERATSRLRQQLSIGLRFTHHTKPTIQPRRKEEEGRLHLDNQAIPRSLLV